MRNIRILLAEAIGTMILIIGGPGTAVIAGDRVGTPFVALAFGFSLLIAVHTVGRVSGCHINPAVTAAMAMMRKTPLGQVPAYVGGQLMGGILGALAVLVMRKGAPGGFEANSLNFATNLWGSVESSVGDVQFYDLGAVALAEILLTALLVFVWLAVTDEGESPDYTGIVLGVTLALIHLVSIPIDNTSVNPVRSLSMAVFAGGDSLEQLWAFIVFPLIGSVVGVFAWLAVDDSRLEDTLLGDVDPLVSARDAATKAAAKLDDALD